MSDVLNEVCTLFKIVCVNNDPSVKISLSHSFFGSDSDQIVSPLDSDELNYM